MARDTMRCGYCDGTGHAPLRQDMQITLNACRDLAERGETITSRTVSERLGGDREETVSQRLRALADYGFLVRGEREDRRSPWPYTLPRRHVRRGGRAPLRTPLQDAIGDLESRLSRLEQQLEALQIDRDE